mmetsp:Transcript_14052/g.36092  ORF Transcript_14052/g.36092 Transcript_14052/m.36092 type:complete len:125 (+) Transcript_14052:621-995(+)
MRSSMDGCPSAPPGAASAPPSGPPAAPCPPSIPASIASMTVPAPSQRLLCLALLANRTEAQVREMDLDTLCFWVAANGARLEVREKHGEGSGKQARWFFRLRDQYHAQTATSAAAQTFKRHIIY